MDINTQMQMNISSIQNAIGIAMLSKAVNQDAGAVALIQKMTQNSTSMTPSADPNIGKNLDIRV